MMYVLYVLIRTHDGLKNHVFPYVYAPYLVLFINTIVRALPYPTTEGHMTYLLYVLIRTHDGPKNMHSPVFTCYIWF